MPKPIASSALLILAALLWTAPEARAVRPLTPPAPEFPPEAAWINAKPLSLKRLRRRRAVVVAFLNTADLHSIRALPVLKAWDESYSLDGAMIVGVFTPDYAFQNSEAAVRASLQRFAVKFPVLFDKDRRVWSAYRNEGWPAFYLVDHKGRIVFDQLGEGHYEAFEKELRAAAAGVPGYGTPSAAPSAKNPPSRDCGEVSRPADLGSRSGREVKASRLELSDTSLLVSSRDGEITSAGKWTAEPDALRLAQKNPDQSAYLNAIYRGAQAFAVLSPGSGSTRFLVRQDGLWLHPGNAGPDVELDDDGRSFVTVETPRLYGLTRNRDDSVHSLTLTPLKSGAAVHGLSFADRCLPAPLP